MTDRTDLLSKSAAVLYGAWGGFHVYVSWQIFELALHEQGIAQGRLLQLAAYMMTISLFAIIVGIWRVAKNDPLGFWFNLVVVGWADAIWVLVVVLPGYVPLGRGLAPPAVFLLAAVLSALAYRRRSA
jgi:hypothetical protein